MSPRTGVFKVTAGRPCGYNASVKLTERQRRHLRGLAHPLKPVIQVGNAGMTDGVVAETARALHDHELIKVRWAGADREARDAGLKTLAARTGSTLVTRIGHVAVLYRPRPDLPRIVLPAQE
jgi:RNA-binding protein